MSAARARGTAKAQVTRLKRFIAENLESASASLLEVKIELLEKALEEFQKVQTKIEETVSEEEIQAETDVRIDFEETYCNLKASLMEKLKSLSKPIADAAACLAPIISGSNSHTILEKVKIPPFAGNYEDFIPFRDLFMESVHNDPNIPPARKLHYLRVSLQGEAEQLIKSIPLSADNYDQAWKLLNSRYSNTRLITRSYMNKIFTTTRIQTDSAAALKVVLDNFSINIRSLENLGLESSSLSDAILTYMLASKLDPKTNELWETEASKADNVPGIKEMLQFVEKRMMTLLSLPESKPVTVRNIGFKSNAAIRTHATTANMNLSCYACEKSHLLHLCPTFQKLPVDKRFEIVRNASICFNCFRKGHRSPECISNVCKHCRKKHHSLLHVDNTTNPSNQPIDRAIPTVSTNSIFVANDKLLATAVVNFEDKFGAKIPIRVVLDPCSHANFITSKLACLLKLKRNPVEVNIRFLDNECASAKNYVTCTVSSRLTDFSARMNALVIPTVTDDLPIQAINYESWSYNVKGMPLADPKFYEPGPIDALLCVEFFLDILLEGKIDRTDTSPAMRNTVFGWIIAGKIPRSSIAINQKENVHVNFSSLSDKLEQFWRIEEAAPEKNLTAEEQLCELHYCENTTRANSGRYIVKLPFKKDRTVLGESRSTAARILNYTQKRLNKHQKSMYTSFMQDYINSGHMSPVPPPDLNETTFYLPHHPVFKENSLTTKLRVVFNGTKPSSSNVSLNDLLMTGPTIQDDLFCILIRFRFHLVAFCADIAKMYRQVKVHPADRNLQRILWYNSAGEVQDYTLNTVTYGLASSAFLAIRTMHKLADDEAYRFPEASEVVKQDFYVDDLVSGAATPAEASNLIQQLTNLMESGGFPLRKWACSQPDVLSSLAINSENVGEMLFNASDEVGTLGVCWKPTNDLLALSVNVPTPSKILTKRSVLSEASRLFDPLGLAAPVIILFKVFLQELWKSGVDWDTPLSSECCKIWHRYRTLLSELIVEVPRCVILPDSKIQLHGFCDASEKAYGAVIYVRSANAYGNVSTFLLCAKTRVAPLDKLTIARLELCGALLLSRLFDKVKAVIKTVEIESHFWCDSMITLHWIKSDPSRWKTFVSNRTAEIRRKTPAPNWHHIPTEMNPADLASRGIKTTFPLLWWHGPEFINLPIDQWPQSPHTLQSSIAEDQFKKEERKPKIQALHSSISPDAIFERYSNFHQFIDVIAYCLRFRFNASTPPPSRLIGPLSAAERQKATLVLVRRIQAVHFAEFKSIGKLAPLSPFVAEDGIIRVGGRLANSNLDYAHRHPILLPANHPFTLLLIRQRHLDLLHAPTQFLIADIRREFWIVGGKSLAKRVISQCVPCRKMNARLCHQVMGQLPECRVTPSAPFDKVGIDFAGPFRTRHGGPRSRIITKAYLCAFVCLNTKAVHLEAVTDLSTAAFLAALSRFVSRRGSPSLIMTDNGTNFVGAARELRKICAQSDVQAKYGISWEFIPPSSPHFGGIWEAVVKSVKTHMQKTIAAKVLAIEELFTIFARIEACLNSRPLCPISDDPHDYEALTPGHFLIGRPLTALPEQDVTSLKNPVRRWVMIQQFSQFIWKRWATEYLHSLQRRAKWVLSQRNLAVGDLVTWKPNTLPTSWNVGRIIKVFPGTDGHIRVVDVRTSSGIFRRPITKLALLIPEPPADGSGQ